MTSTYHRLRVRIYAETDPELFTWYQRLAADTLSKGEKSTQIRELLRAGLQAQTTNWSPAVATAAVDTAALVAALLPEFRAVLDAALATAHLTRTADTAAENLEDDPEMQDFLAALDDSLFLAD